MRTRRRRTAYEEKQAQEEVAGQAKEEQYRRKWAVETACQLEETQPESVLALADRLYEYVYGARP